MKTSLFYTLTLLIFTSCNFISEKPKSISEKILIALEENNVPSLAIGVIENGKIDLLKGFGYNSRTDSTKVNENSIFQIASQSKMFTGIIVNNLIDEGKLNLDEPITAYFPKEIIGKSRARLNKVKLEYLLNHTSGIPSNACSVYSQRIEGEAWTKGYSKEKLLADINNIKLNFEPGSQFQYSNSGYAIVGFICENVSGLEYEDLLKKYVSDKYYLKNTVVHLKSQQQKILVTPYKKQEGDVVTKPSRMGMATPASAIYSNASDLTKILLDQIKAYRLYQEKETRSALILTNTVSEMDDGLKYGFGLIKETKGENIKYGHGGDADGFACEYFFNPTENKGVVILTSSGGSWVGELANEILKDLK